MKAKTWDGQSINDQTNYVCILRESFYGLPPIRVAAAGRLGRWPVVGGVERPGRVLEADIYIKNLASLSTLQDNLLRWFDPEGEVSKVLVCEDEAGGNDRYVMAICQALEEAPRSAGLHYHATLVVDGDVRWRAVTASTDTWAITATGQTKVLNNTGKDDAYPRLQIKPTSAKTGGYSYKRFVRVLWKALAGATNYPTDICNDGFDTATLVGAGKMQSDGDDLRVLVNGVEVDRWLDGINTATTKVWVNLTWQAATSATLGTAIASSGAITTIEASTDISGFPASGILMVDDEVFTYTSKSDSAKQFGGVTRAAKGTSMAAHTTSDTIYWLQHEVYILYGNSSATAPSVDATKVPTFELASSTNGSWDYDAFFDITSYAYQSRPGTWTRPSSTYTYGGNQGAAVLTGEFVELGVKTYTNLYPGLFQIFNPCGITNANFANGEKHSDELASWDANSGIYSSADGSTWVLEDDIPVPSVVDTWESWSDNQALTAGSSYVRLAVLKTTASAGKYQYIEAADVTLTLDASYTPTMGIGSEEGNYTLACKVTNNTTGVAIEVGFTMALNQEIEVDTDAKTVTYLADGSNQFQALTVTSGPRRDWLKLQPGNNTLQYDDVGTNGVTVDFDWEKRSYQ